MKNEERSAVVLLSGGLDSYTAAAMLKASGFRLYALSIRYGQRHVRELEAARRVASSVGAKAHLELAVDLARVGGSALTADIAVPKDRAIDSSIPVTYVPARNTVFLSLALAWAEALGIFAIGIGANALDYSGYPDCRPEFVAAFEALARVATRAGVEGRLLRVHTPLMTLDKAGIIQLGTSLGVDYALTHSCYDPAPDGAACGRCDSCLLRIRGFRAAGVPDPTRYATAGNPAGGAR
jgi:7-cyano-7-deazaguanine synthase